VFDLAEIIRQHERDALEFKRALSSPEKVMRTVVAFANGAGGRLLIGVEDGFHKILGVLDAVKTEEQLANFISDI
jgi:predicted HTH transcriptional regulator